MKNFRLTILFLFITFNISLAQTFPYILATETDDYNKLTEATELTAVGDFWDDPEFVAPLGFEFEFFGEEFDSIFFIGLGGILSFNGGDLGANEQFDLLIPYIDDLMDVENADQNMQSIISYTTEGVPGSQIFKLEWKNCGYYTEIDYNFTANNRISFQLWLYEADNSIEVRFGPNEIVNPDLFHDFSSPIVGMMENYTLDPFTFDDYFDTLYYLSGSTNDPDIAGVDTSIFSTYNLAGLVPHPEEGRVYRFVNVETHIADLSQPLAVKIYPNVVQEEVIVQIDESALNNSTQFFITNQMGQIISNNTITKNGERINVVDFPSGVYYLTVFNEEGKVTKKFVKQ